MIKTGIIDPNLTLNMVRDDPLIAFDTETSGLSVRDFVCGWVVTNREFSTYVPVRHEAGGNIPDALGFEKALADAFKTRATLGHRTVGHNLGFDLRASLRHGVVIGGKCEDTMINMGLIDDTTIGYGLDDCSIRFGVTPKKGEDLYREIARRFGGMPDRSSMQHFWRMPGDDPVVTDYATGDGVSTLELWEKQQVRLDEDELRVPWKLECDLMPYLARAHNRGLKVSEEYAGKCDEVLKTSLAQAKKKFPEGFNVRSVSDLIPLFEANGYTQDMFARTEPTKAHPNGQISFREAWLKKSDIGKDILTVRQLEKAQASFIAPLVSTYNVDGRVHPVLNQSKSDEYGVIGARMSCSDPNLQAYPKRNVTIGKLVRPLITADEGMIIEEADAKQQEPRFFTHYSEDPALVAGYRSGTMDIHDRASEVLHIPRDYAKRLGLGMLTMMSPKTLAMHMGYSLQEAQRDHRLFLDDAFPHIRDFQQTAVRVFKRRGYVKSILGRRAYCGDPRFAYRAVSRIIQNSGGDHMKTVLLRCFEFEDVYPDNFQVLMSIHDSAIWQRTPDFDIRPVVKAIENVANEFNLLVPIPFDIGSGHDWGEASYGNK